MLNVSFASRKLECCHADEGHPARAWGTPFARGYVLRVSLLYTTRPFEDVGTLRTLRLHPLRGKRNGQWAITLQGRWRLIVKALDAGGILVQEVSNHYDD